MKEKYLWEVAFECGNKVGGIWTVITSKSEKMKEKYKNNYFSIGFFDKNKNEIIEKTPPEFLSKVFSKLNQLGIDFKFGSWVDANNVNIILVDSHKLLQTKKDEIKTEFWEKYKLDSLNSSFDFDEPLVWGYSVGLLISEVIKELPGNHLVQAHEWLTGGAVLMLKNKVPTVFTTHATVLGRACGGIKVGLNIDEEVKKRGVSHKHSLEKLSANAATVFTTVSESMAKEVKDVLGRKADFVTENALTKTGISELPILLNQKIIYRKRLEDFVRAYFFPYYSLDTSDFPIIYTAGRYEFFNKGYDVFIDALGEVNDHLKKENYKGWFLSMILVPSGTLGIKEEVIQNFSVYKHLKNTLKEDAEELGEELYRGDSKDSAIEKEVDNIVTDLKGTVSRLGTRKGKNPPISAFRLSIDENKDLIISRLKQKGLLNREEDRVKVVFYPVYISKEDSVLGVSYKQFLTASSMGVFLSRYEPWGYTPMEAAAHLGTTLTTREAGFGLAVEKKKGSRGIYLANDTKEVANIIETFIKADKDSRLSLEMSAHRFVKQNFTWEVLIKNYFDAYDLAQSLFSSTNE